MSGRPPRPVRQIDRIDLYSLPAAVNMDDIPGPDGLKVRVFLFQLAEPAPVTVTGTLEFLLYDGKVPPARLAEARPIHLWSFQQGELARYLTRSMIGWGYSMPLAWGPDAPTAPIVTLAARYMPPAGKPLYSAPIFITGAEKVRGETCLPSAR